MTEEKHEGQSGGVNISGGRVQSGGDIVGRDKVTHGDNVTTGNIGAGASVAMGRGAQAVAGSGNVNMNAWDDWRSQMFKWVDAQPKLSAADKQDVKDSVEKIQAEAKKGEQADPQRLERLINSIALVAPDAFEVAITTIMNPLAGIGLALKKIADRAKIERAQQAGSAT